jgi:hypothetical protein
MRVDPSPASAVEVYWRPGCGFCSTLLRGLRRSGLPLRGRHLARPRGGRAGPLPGGRQRDRPHRRDRRARAGQPDRRGGPGHGRRPGAPPAARGSALPATGVALVGLVGAAVVGRAGGVVGGVGDLAPDHDVSPGPAAGGGRLAAAGALAGRPAAAPTRGGGRRHWGRGGRPGHACPARRVGQPARPDPGRPRWRGHRIAGAARPRQRLRGCGRPAGGGAATRRRRPTDAGSYPQWACHQPLPDRAVRAADGRRRPSPPAP